MFTIAILSLSVVIFILILFRTPPFSESHSPRRRPLPDSPIPQSTPRRLSLPTKRRSSDLKGLPSTPPLHRTKFVNPFNRHSRSRTLSPPSSLKSPDTPSTLSSPSPQSTARRTLVNKFKSIFKSTPSQSSPIMQSNPIVNTINIRFRRKPVPRTQPYGPPWNAPMPVPDFSLSLPNSAHITSPTSRKGRKPSTHHSSTPRRAPTLPGQVSPRTFITELDEKLSLLQQQRIQDTSRMKLTHHDL